MFDYGYREVAKFKKIKIIETLNVSLTCILYIVHLKIVEKNPAHFVIEIQIPHLKL